MTDWGNLLLFAMVSIFSKLDEQLYMLHLECADKWPNIWHTVLTTIHKKINTGNGITLQPK
jgi:hypothetical protein